MTAVAAGAYHSLALKNNGTVKAWGYNYYGQLGTGGAIPGTDSSSPATVSSLTTVKAIAAGGYHSLALKTDGTVWAWGFGYYGQLGNAANDNHSTPVKVSFPTGTVITAIAAGLNHSLAIKSDGTVWTWGRNDNGQLGNGHTGDGYDSNVPVQVTGLTGIIAIAGGGNDDTYTGSHSLALKSNGTVWAWGYNFDGELGDGTGVDSNTPVQASGLTNIIGIAAGGLHSLAVTSSGTVKAWGLNDSGQLGDNSYQTRFAPVSVLNLTGMKAVSAGSHHSLAFYYPLPPEVAPGTSLATALTWSDKSTLTWPGDSLATGYYLYKGTSSGLPNLLNSNNDACYYYFTTNTNYGSLGNPSSGSFYWYLVVGSNAIGQGSAGNARIGTTAVARIVNSTTTCP